MQRRYPRTRDQGAGKAIASVYRNGKSELQCADEYQADPRLLQTRRYIVATVENSDGKAEFVGPRLRPDFKSIAHDSRFGRCGKCWFTSYCRSNSVPKFGSRRLAW